MTSPAVSLENVCFGYDAREILHNVDLRIDPGSFAVVVGPNGGGKTTLLRIVLGLLEPDYGEVRVLGEEPGRAVAQIGYVPQSLQFDRGFPVSVLDVVLMGRVERHAFGPHRKEDVACARRCLEWVGLGETARESFASLSGGQRQRALIAQALACQPRLLLLDEPCANLDTPGTRTIYHLLKQLNRHLTIVMVSHNLNVVESFASHIVCVNRTADMHDIRDVSRQALANGDWLRLFHDSCPVDRLDHGENDTPHLGCPHDAALDRKGRTI